MQEIDIEADLDPRNQPGYAVVRIAGAGNAESQGVRGLAFRVTRLDREKDNQLGVDGWSPAETDLLAEEVWSEPNGDLVLRVGPRVVDHVPYDTQVEITLDTLDGVGVVIWPDLPTSSTRGDAGPQSDAAARQAAADAERKRAEQAEAERRRKAEEEAERRRQEAQEEEARARAEADAEAARQQEEREKAERERAEREKARQAEAAAKRTDKPEVAASGKRRGVAALGAVAAVVVLLGGLGAAYFLGVLDTGPDTSQTPEDTPGGTAGISPTDDPMGYVRQFVEANPQAKAQYERAVALLEQGAMDAAFVLMTEAALQDHGAANFQIARAYDPTVSDGAVELEAAADAGSALRYYERAIANDHEPAGEALTRLIDHLKERAAEGDRQAQHLLDGRG
jgi:hypothetical protein